MPTPSRLALWLLRRVLPAERHETVSGDLEELLDDDLRLRASPWRAWLWYWRQVLSLACWQLRRPSPLRPPLQSSHGDRMHGFTHDLRYALRALLKAPAFSLVAIATLALGIGANTAMFTLVNGLMLKPLPFARPDELMLVHLVAPDPEGPSGATRELVWSYPKYEVFRDAQSVFDQHAVFTRREWSLTEAGDPERIRGELVGARYLATLGVTPRVGRDFTADNDRPSGENAIVLISHELWQRRFNGEADVIGRVIRLDARPFTIVGVLPSGFRGLTGEAQIFAPVTSVEARDLATKWNHWLYVVARRKALVTAPQAQQAVRALGLRIDTAIGQPPGGFIPPIGATAAPLDGARVDPLVRRATLVLMAAVGLVLLIGCVNLANLMATRAASRRREVAVRLALGATRGRVVRQLLAESLLLAVAGAVAGLGLASGAMHAAAALMPESGLVLRSRTFGLTRIGAQMVDIDLPTLVFTLVTAFTTAVLFGLLPAWRASRSDLTQAMKAGAAASLGGHSRLFGARHLLIVAETALALVLLVASSLMLQSVANLQQTKLGFDPQGVVTLRLQLPESQYDTVRSARLFADLVARVGALPGVASVAYGSCAPVSGGCDTTSLTFPDRPPVAKSAEPLTGVHYATRDLFRTLGIRLVRGRTFTERDTSGQPRVAVINETLARTHFGHTDPIGQRLALGTGGGFEKGAEIVGIVRDLRYASVEAPPRADTYVPLLQRPRQGGLLFVRTTLDAAALAPALRGAVAALDRDLPISDVRTMTMRYADATWRTRLSAQLLAFFAGLALLLAAVGVYVVMAQAVQQRTREIGLRLALGAGRRSIFAMVMGRALAVVSAGVTVGVALSLASMRILESLLYEVTPHDPATLAALAASLLAVALLASYVPARRAMRVDPLTSLRAD
jgi:putative ABC transport system permease protein